MVEFEVWERRDVGSEFGPYSSWVRSMLDVIETGWHSTPDSAVVDGWREVTS